jgi:hypothetical protein
LAASLLAFAPGQFLRNHGHAGAISTDIHHGGGGALALGRFGGALLPLLGGGAHALDHPLNLPGRDADAAGVQEVSFGLEI